MSTGSWFVPHLRVNDPLGYFTRQRLDTLRLRANRIAAMTAKKIDKVVVVNPMLPDSTLYTAHKTRSGQSLLQIVPDCLVDGWGHCGHAKFSLRN